MAAMAFAVIDHDEAGWGERRGQAAGDFGGHRAGGKFAHPRYIERLDGKRRE
jgi:hypothetical protein